MLFRSAWQQDAAIAALAADVIREPGLADHRPDPDDRDDGDPREGEFRKRWGAISDPMQEALDEF